MSVDVEPGRCQECGFDWHSPPDHLAAELRSFGSSYGACLTRFLVGEDRHALVRARPDPAVWSAVEYAAHMRDVIDFYAERIARVLQEERPAMPAADFEAMAEDRRYRDEDPDAVVAVIGESAGSVADTLEHLSEEQWHRVGVGSQGGERTVLVLARRLVHDGHHHLLDIGRVLRSVRSQKVAPAPRRLLDSWRDARTATAYAEFVRRFPMYGETSRDLVGRLGDLSEATVLDLACGTGATTMAVLERAGPRTRVLAVDGSKEMLEVAREAVQDPRVEWMQAEAEELTPEELPTLDAVVCNSAIWQVDMAAVLPRLAAALRAGGRMAFNIGTRFLLDAPQPPPRAKPSLVELMAAIAVLDHDFVPARMGPPPGRQRPLTMAGVRELLAGAGLEVMAEEVDQYESSLDQERAWLSIPIFTEMQFRGLTYDQRMDCLEKAYLRAQPGATTASTWAVFVARKP